MDIQTNIKEILTELPSGVRLVAVSKFHPNECIEAAYQAGQRIFGESKVQELTEKYRTLPKDIEWHFIGHLQTNKVKYIAPFISMIHAVDSFKLLEEINKQASKVNRIIPCLLEIHIAQEESKYGFTFESSREMLQEGAWKNLKNISINGVMGMATNTEDSDEIRKEFKQLHDFFTELKQTYFPNEAQFCEISMGMSHAASVRASSSTTALCTAFGPRRGVEPLKCEFAKTFKLNIMENVRRRTSRGSHFIQLGYLDSYFVSLRNSGTTPYNGVLPSHFSINCF